MANSRRKQACGFCGSTKDDNADLVEGTALGPSKAVYICARCVKLCSQQLAEAGVSGNVEFVPTQQMLAALPKPLQVYEHLNEYVISQERAKRRLSVQIVNHYRRLIDHKDMDGAEQGACRSFLTGELSQVRIDKSNVILLGPSGTGKTLLARALAEKLDVPFYAGDATTLTEAGYVGEDVENLLLGLLRAADFDLAAAQRGVIYIDEIDKLKKSGGNISITRDVSGEGVQQSLLKLVEGTIANIPPNGGRKHPEAQYIQMDTSNILFIVGGAFVGIEEIVKKRLHRKQMGFGSVATSDKEVEQAELLRQVTHEDLIEYGLIPELVGRLPVLANLDPLSIDDLKRVLTQPKNALVLQERKKMALHNVNLQFTEDALQEIAQQAHKQGTGARGLRSIMEGFMEDLYFDIPEWAKGKTFIVDRDVVRKTKQLFKKPRTAA